MLFCKTCTAHLRRTTSMRRMSGVSKRQNVIGMSLDDILKLAADLGVAPYRSKQIYNWIYRNGATLFQDMNIPKPLAESLEQTHAISYGSLVSKQKSKDGTRKFLIGLGDDGPKSRVETVFIPESDRGTLCVSSQIGCSLSCKFCHTGTQKLERNLTAGEIIGQYMIAATMLGDYSSPSIARPRVSNVVFMGQGEPLYNYRNVSKAVSLLTDKDGIAIPKSRITVSTSGVAPLIPRIAKDLGVGLAVSLHSANNEVRSEIMPINRTYPLNVLFEGCREYVRAAGTQNRRITFEYVLLEGVNDSDADAKDLVKKIRNFPALVNLIPFNPWPGSAFRPSGLERVNRFCELVRDRGIHASVRTPRGQDILAACGQLKSAMDGEQTELLAVSE